MTNPVVESILAEAGEVERFTLEADEARTSLESREAELESARLEAHTAEEQLEIANTTALVKPLSAE